MRVGVIGAGYLGKFHIEKFSKIPGCELTCVADVDRDALARAGSDYQIETFADYREMMGRVDAVSIVVPTPLHHQIASFFLDKGIHLFIEKPATVTVDQCRDLLARRPAGTTVQVGHIERFNPAYSVIKKHARKPVAVLCRRKSPFSPRGADVDIVFDLMIHDIDIALDLCGRDSSQVRQSCCRSIVTGSNDYILAALDICGVSVSLEASRVCGHRERTITVVEEDRVWEGNYMTQEVFRKDRDGEELISTGKSDQLYDELTAFISSVETGGAPPVTLEDSCMAIGLAAEIIAHRAR